MALGDLCYRYAPLYCVDICRRLQALDMYFLHEGVTSLKNVNTNTRLNVYRNREPSLSSSDEYYLPVGMCRESWPLCCLVHCLLRDHPLFGVLCVGPSLKETSSLSQRANSLPDQTEHEQSHDDREHLCRIEMVCKRDQDRDDPGDRPHDQPKWLGL